MKHLVDKAAIFKIPHFRRGNLLNSYLKNGVKPVNAADSQGFLICIPLYTFDLYLGICWFTRGILYLGYNVEQVDSQAQRFSNFVHLILPDTNFENEEYYICYAMLLFSW